MKRDAISIQQVLCRMNEKVIDWEMIGKPESCVKRVVLRLPECVDGIYADMQIDAEDSRGRETSILRAASTKDIRSIDRELGRRT